MKVPGFALLWLIFPYVLWGADFSEKGDTAFRMALEREGNFLEAASFYAAAFQEDPASGEKAYNMANALALGGDKTGALLMYGLALGVKPGQRDYRHNRDQILREENIPVPPRKIGPAILSFPLYLIGLRGSWFLLGLCCLLAFLTSLMNAVVSRRRGLRFSRITLPSPLFPLLISLCIYLFPVCGFRELRMKKYTVVRGAEVSLRQGDSPLYSSLKTLRKGEEILILEEREGWLKVRALAGGGTGWLPALEVYNPPAFIDAYAAGPRRTVRPEETERFSEDHSP